MRVARKLVLPEQLKPRTGPIQFSLGNLLQAMLVIALWCAAGIVRDNLTVGIAYATVTAIVTWVIVGRWAVRWSRPACRQALAATTTLLMAGGAGVCMLIHEPSSLPLCFVVGALPYFFAFSLATPTSAIGGAVLSVLTTILLLTLLYLFWLLIYWMWDRMERFAYSASKNQGPLASGMTLILVLINVPVVIVILAGGCYGVSGHGGGTDDILHEWTHCMVHVAMVALAGVIIVVLQRASYRSHDPLPRWLKLLTLGYLNLYGVMTMVALFPFSLRFTLI